MKQVQHIAAEIEGVELRRGPPRTPVSSICRDSRQAEDGALFVALKGERVDGHDFIEDAVERGASAVFVERGRECPADVAVLEGRDLREKLGLVASWFYDHPSRQLEVVGVTGTNGKTSVSYLLEQIFETAGKTPGIIGTVEYRWADRRLSARNTTPDGLALHRTLRRMADDGVDVAVIEVSSHGLAHGRVAGTRFSAGVFTNLSRDHVEFHGSVEAYRRAKWSLFVDHLGRSGRTGATTPVAVVNLDDDEGRRLYDRLEQRAQSKLVGHATDPDETGGRDIDFGARDLEVGLEGLAMTVDDREAGSYDVELGLPGRFNAENALSALATARSLGVEPQAVCEGLAAVHGIPGRMQSVEVGAGGPAIFVDYAHTPEALRRALETLGPLVEGRLWVVFGCGGDRDRSKRGEMGRIAARLADRVVVTSDNPRSEPPEAIVDDIEEGLRQTGVDPDESRNWYREVDRGEAIEFAVLRAAGRDAILIAGKGHETYQQRDGRRRDFDDRRVAKEALDRRGEQSCRN